MSRKQLALFEPTLVVQALKEAVKKLNPQAQWRNPVMFIVWIGSLLTTCISIAMASGAMPGNALFSAAISGWLWVTVLFANFAEALAEGRSKAQANSLKGVKKTAFARKLREPKYGAAADKVPADQLRKGDIVLVEAGDIIPCDGEVIEGGASVDESAITGESAPVIRESGGDFASVTGGTRILSDWLVIECSVNPGETFLDRMIAMVEGAQRRKTPNEIALTILLIALTIVFLLATATLWPFSAWGGNAVSVTVLVALLVCLIPTTIGGLLSAIGVAGMSRMLGANVIATSGRAVEAAGDVDVLLLDKTGTITLGNRQASEFIPAQGVDEKTLADAAQLASLADETPEGRSIVILAKQRFNLRERDVQSLHATFVPFTAQSRMSGINIDNRMIRKGSVDAIRRHVEANGGHFPTDVDQKVDQVARQGATPLVVVEGSRVLGVIALKDIVKGGIKERFAPDLDQVLVALDEPPARTINNAPDSRSFKDKWRVQIQGCVVAAALCAVITLIAMQWLMAFDAANLVMLYLLGVVVVALFYGRWPSVVATVINVVSFDLFFIAPRGTLAVSDVQYLLTFAVMLTVGLVIGNLTAGVRYQARVARYREQRTRHLYEMSKALAVGRSPQDIAATSEQFIASTFHARSQVLLPDDNGKLQPLTHPQGMTPWDDAIAQWSFDKGLPAGAGTDTLPGVPYQILPLKSGEKTYGLVVVEPGNLRQLMIPEQQRLLETFTLLVANALERLTLTASEEQARMASEREQIRNALLAALSHDLRTPLTVLFGQAEILTLDLASEGSPHARQASEIRQHVLNTTRLVNNLLDMARIQSGGFNLKKEWLTLEEVVGSALQMLEPGLSSPINLSLPEPLTLIHVDGPLFERVLINLLENAVKYAGAQAEIGIDAHVEGENLQLDVWDNGPGLPPGRSRRYLISLLAGIKSRQYRG